jgi:hypothetical protein
MIYLDPNEKNRVYQRQRQKQGGQSPLGSYNTYNKLSQKFSGDTPTTSQGTDSSWWGDTKDWISSLFESGESDSAASTGSSDSSSSGLGTFGYVLAAILAQMAATNATDTNIEGQETGNFFSQNDEGNWRPAVATEPWLGLVHDKLGWDPTAGEYFDAATRNGDWENAAERFPAAADYWADPIRSWLGYDTWKNIVGDDVAMIIDPIGGFFQQIGEWF